MKKLVSKIILLFSIALLITGCSNKEPEMTEEQKKAIYEEKQKNNAFKYIKQKNPVETKNILYINKNDKWEEVPFEEHKNVIKNNYFDLTMNKPFDKDRDISVILKREEYSKVVPDIKIIWTKEFVLKYNILPFLKANNITKYKLYKFIDNEYIYNSNITDNTFYVVVFDNDFFPDETYKKMENYNSKNKLLNEKDQKDVFELSVQSIKDNFLYSIHDDNFLYYEYLKNMKSLKYDLYYNTSNVSNKEFNEFFLAKYSQISNENFLKYFSKKLKTYYLFYQAEYLDLPFFDLVNKEYEDIKNVLLKNNSITNDNIEKEIIMNEKNYIEKIKNYNDSILLEKQFVKLINQINLYKYTIYININNKIEKHNVLLDDKVRNYKNEDLEFKINKNIINVITFYLKNNNLLAEIPLISNSIAKDLIKNFNLEDKKYEEYYYMKNGETEVLIVK